MVEQLVFEQGWRCEGYTTRTAGTLFLVRSLKLWVVNPKWYVSLEYELTSLEYIGCLDGLLCSMPFRGLFDGG